MISTLDFTIPFNTPLYRILQFFSISILCQTILEQKLFLVVKYIENRDNSSKNDIIKEKGEAIMFKEFGVTNLEVTKDDIYKNPSNPILRMYDDDELIGTFSILTGEVLENLDLADYDIRFAQKQMELNRDNYLETWKDYVGLLHA